MRLRKAQIWAHAMCALLAITSSTVVARAETITPADYAGSIRIKFDGYTGAAPLTNFPALIEFRDGVYGFRYSDMNSADYSDLRFTKDDGVTCIPFEVDEWDSTPPVVVAPDTLSGCLLWLKADSGALTNAAGGVTNWLDRSGSNRHASSRAAANHPQLVLNALNGKPAVRFSGANDNYVEFPRLTNIRTVFWVIKEAADAASATRFLLGDKGGATYHFHRGVGSKRIWDASHAPIMYEGVTELNGIEIDGRATDAPTAMGVLSVRTASNATANSLAYDRNIAGRSWHGDVAEMIIYDRVLTKSEMRSIYLYLEYKYAISIENDRKSSVWVQIPELTNNAAIYAYWGNPGATVLPDYTTNGAVWSESYVGVYHFTEGMNALSFADSSGAHNHMSSLASPAQLNGFIGQSRGYIRNNAEQPPRISSPSGGLALDHLTVSMWVNLANGETWRNWWGIEAGSGNHLRMEIDDENPGRCNIYNTNISGAGSLGDSTTPVEDGRWHMLTFTANTASNEAKVYVDGVQDGSTAAWSATAVATGFKVGASWAGGYVGAVGGRIDEARFSKTARSADWIKASYDNQLAPSKFCSIALDYYYDTSTALGLQAGNGTWSTGASTWCTEPADGTDLLPWEQGAHAIFAGAGTSEITVEAVAAQGLTFNGSGYQLTGGTIDIDRFGIMANQSSVIGSAITLAKPQVWTTASGKTLLISGSVDTRGNTLLTAGEGDATISGIISGAGALIKEETGTLLLDALNSFTGGTTVHEGTLQLSQGGAAGALRGTLNIERAGQVELLCDNALGYDQRVSVLNINGGLLNNTGAGDNGWAITINMIGGELRSNGGVSSAEASSRFSLGGGSRINTAASPDTAIISGRISVREANPDNLLVFNVAEGSAPVDLHLSAALTPQGGGGIVKRGPGVMSLAGASTYTGLTRIDNGTLLVNNTSGSGTGDSAVQINGGVLGGTGTVTAATSMGPNGGFILPGDGVSALHLAGGIDMRSAATAGLCIEINGADKYSSLEAAGEVILGGCHLVVKIAGAVAPGDKYFIIVNDSTEPVSGTFKGLLQGETIDVDGYRFTISYTGDVGSGALSDGNDVVLYNATMIPPPSAYWKEIGFPGYTRNATLTNFPALIVFQEKMEEFSYATFLAPAGGDLRFYSDKQKSIELNYEIEQWDTGGTSYIWVQVPELRQGTTIWAYWGDPSLTTPPSYTTNGATWDTSFAGVWHLSDTGNISTEATANAFHGANNNAMSINGRIGKAYDFAGSQSVTLPPDALASINNNITVTFWQMGGENNQSTIFSAGGAGNNRIVQAHVPWEGKVYWDAGNTSYDRIDKAAATTEYKGEWSHWSFTKNAVNGTMRIYRNGELWHSGSQKNIPIFGANRFRLGGRYDGAEFYRGSIDEFRLARVERSAEWLWASFVNQSKPTEFTGTTPSAYWDTSTAVGLQSGDGRWDNGATAAWSADTTAGSSPLLAWDGSRPAAHFSALGGGTITVANNLEAAALMIEAPGYTLTGGSLTLSAGIQAHESVTIRTPITLSAPQIWYVAVGKTLTINGAGWRISNTLIKRGGGKLLFINHRYSYCTADLDIIVDEGEVEFGSDYWNAYSATDPMRIHVMSGASFSTPLKTPFGVRNADSQGSLAQIIFEENSIWRIGDYTSIQNGTYNGEGRIVLRGATTQGGRFIPQSGTTIETRASTITSIINTEFNGYVAGEWTLLVEKGAAEPDVRINAPINGNVTRLIKSGNGVAELTGDRNAYKETTVAGGTLLVNNTSGSGTGSGAVTVNGGTLAGTGIIAGALGFGANGGQIAPGSATGTLTVNNNVNFTSIGAKSFHVTIDADNALQYSVLDVNGTVTLDNAALSVTLNRDFNGVKKLFVITNDGTDPVSGTFNGIAEGGMIKAGATSFRVHYAADSASGKTTGGNDVLLISIASGTTMIIR
ncbi:MAG: DUF2341 domain-containing protein [Kiritimatiellae bacterium]|nr:DUF2341 domain-containing protein [Kiritimatiellia bacterium]